MNDYDSETLLQDLLLKLLDGFDDNSGELTMPVQHQVHYLLTILAIFTQTLDCLDGRLINLNTELNNINNALKGRGYE